MPMNFAVIIGGMATTIGTSTNLLIVSLARDHGVPPIDMFEFTRLVVGPALLALLYLWLVAPRLLERPRQPAGRTGALRRFDADPLYRAPEPLPRQDHRRAPGAGPATRWSCSGCSAARDMLAARDDARCCSRATGCWSTTPPRT